MKRAIVAVAAFVLLALSGCDDMPLRNMIVDLVTKASVAVPEAPSGLSANSFSVSQIHLSWTDNSNNETGFKIERSPDGSSGWTQVFLTSADATGWDDTGLSEETTYYYRVRASNAAGDSPYSNTASDTTYLPSFSGGVAIKAVVDQFTMGDGSYGHNVSESFSYSFTMSKYEITNSQFAQFISDGGYSTQTYWTTNGWNYKQSQGWTQPAYWTDANFNGANQPVVGVSWYEAVAYCNWRSTKEGLITPAYDAAGHVTTLVAFGYRLPTEVEWEYAAAKGARRETERLWAYSGGTSPPFDPSKVVCSVLPASASNTVDVGSKSTAGDTPQGLADMSGNVWEWCSDNNQSDASVVSAVNRYYFVDDSTSQYLVVRGGAWNNTNVSNFRCAYRDYNNPYFRNYYFGFRVVRP